MEYLILYLLLKNLIQKQKQYYLFINYFHYPGMGMQPGMGMGHHPGMGMQPGMGMGHHPGMGMQPGMGMGHHPGMGMGPHY